MHLTLKANVLTIVKSLRCGNANSIYAIAKSQLTHTRHHVWGATEELPLLDSLSSWKPTVHMRIDTIVCTRMLFMLINCY